MILSPICAGQWNTSIRVRSNPGRILGRGPVREALIAGRWNRKPPSSIPACAGEPRLVSVSSGVILLGVGETESPRLYLSGNGAVQYHESLAQACEVEMEAARGEATATPCGSSTATTTSSRARIQGKGS